MKKTIGERLRAAVATVLAGVIALSSAQAGGNAMAAGTWGESSPLITGVELYNLDQTLPAGTVLTKDTFDLNGDLVKKGTAAQAGQVPVQIDNTSENVSKTANVRVLYDFSVPSDADIPSGTTYTFTLPQEIVLPGDIDQNLVPPGFSQDNPMAAVHVDSSNGQGTITFTSEVNRMSYVAGAFFLDAKFGLKDGENVNPVTLNFDLNGLTTPFPINFDQPAPDISKEDGQFDPGSNTVLWTVHVNTLQTNMVNAVIHDSVDQAGLTYVADSFALYEGGSASGSNIADAASLDTAAGSGGWAYTLPSPTAKEYTIQYRTSVDPDTYGTQFTNTANLTQPSGKNSSDTGTVKPAPTYITKSGVPSVESGTQYLTWTITFGIAGVTLDDAVIADPVLAGLPAGSSLVSVLYDGLPAGKDSAAAVDARFPNTGLPGVNQYSTGGSDMTYNAGPVSGVHTLTVKVAFPSDYLLTNHTETYTNTATLFSSSNGYLEKGVPGPSGNVGVGQGGGGNAVLSKDKAVTAADRQNGIIEWTITVNASGRTLTNPVLTDTIGTGTYNSNGTTYKQTYQGDFKVVDNSTGSTVVYDDKASTGNSGTFAYDSAANTLRYAWAGSTSDTYTVTYTTKVDDASVWEGNDKPDYTNQAVLNTDGTTGISTSVTQTANFPGNALSKTGGSSAYNYQDHSLTWTLQVNQNQVVLHNVVVTDTLPADQANDTDGNPQYLFVFTGAAHDVQFSDGTDIPAGSSGSTAPYYEYSGRTLTIHLGDLADGTAANRAKTIKVKTHLNSAVDYDAFFSDSFTKTIQNTAAMTSTENPTDTASTGSAAINNTVVSKSAVYTNYKDYVDWNVPIDQNGADIGANVKLTDVLQAGLILDTSSVRLYAQAIGADGSLSPNGGSPRNADGTLQGFTPYDPAKFTGANLSYATNPDGTSTFVFTTPDDLGSVNKPYLLTFRTYIDRGVIKNGAQINNSVTLQGSVTKNISMPGSITVVQATSGGYIAGVAGQMTLKKTDSVHLDQTLAGATFALYDRYGNHLDDYTTGSDGTVLVPYLRFDVPYTLEETGAPGNYQNSLGATSYTFIYHSDDGGQTGYIQQVKSATNTAPVGSPTATDAAPVLAFADALKTGTVQFDKLGDGGAGLAGATFTLTGTALNGDAVNLTSTSQGSGGAVGFTDVPYGGPYTLTETAAPAGYAAIAPVSGIVLNDTTAPSGTLTLSDQTDAAVGQLTITKTGTDADSATPLTGATFTLTDGTHTYTSHDNGNGTYLFTGIALGSTYTLTESTPPAGYTAANITDTFDFTDTSLASRVKTYTVNDSKQSGTIAFTKQNGQGAGLAGAQFGLYLDDGSGAASNTPLTVGGNPVVSNVTDSTGAVAFTDVPYTIDAYARGYWVKEIRTPPNFTTLTSFHIAKVDGTTLVGGTLDLGTKDDTVRKADVSFKKTDGFNPLGGATFTLTGTAADGSTVSQAATSDAATGMVIFQNVPFSTGVYTVEETTVPAAYYQKADPFTFVLNDGTELDSGGNLTLSDADKNTLVVKNIPLGSITVQKQDAGTGDFLDGATFAVKSGYDGNTYTDYTTNADGSVTFKNLPLDPDTSHTTSFTVVEVKTPANYETGTIGTVELTNQDGQRNTLLIPFPNSRKLASVTIHKQDAVDAPLAGAQFTLFDSKTDAVVSASGKTFVGLTGQDGTLTFTGVPYGDYYLKETGVPADYTGDTTAKIPVVLSDTEEKTASNPTGAIVNGGTTAAPTHALDAGIVTNTLMTGTVTLTKTDGTGAVLAGAAFTLSGKSTAGKEISLTAQSGADGRVTFENVPYGSYTVKETGVPANYDGFANAIPVELHESNSNLKDGALDLGKVRNDIKTGTVTFIKQNEFFDPLPGAQFTLSNGSGWSAAAVSGADGTVTFVNVPYGALTLTETQAPAGYYAMAPISIDLTVGNAALQNGVLDLGSYVNIPGTGVLDEFTMRQRARQMAEEREAAARAKNPKTGFGSSAWPAGAAFALFAALGAIPLAAGRRRKHKR